MIIIEQRPVSHDSSISDPSLLMKAIQRITCDVFNTWATVQRFPSFSRGTNIKKLCVCVCVCVCVLCVLCVCVCVCVCVCLC